MLRIRDDDVLFLGAIVPIYGVTRGLSGTILYTATRGIRYRCDEALNGAWEMGLRNHPLFAGFANLLPKAAKKSGKRNFPLKNSRSITFEFCAGIGRRSSLRRTKKANTGTGSISMFRRRYATRFLFAADASYDPASAERYGAFQVKKLYLHLYPEQKLTLDVYRPLPAFGGKNVLEIAAAAFAEHESQVKVDHYRVSNDGFLPAFGLWTPLFHGWRGHGQERSL